MRLSVEDAFGKYDDRVFSAADVGGIRRTVQLWIHGDQTTAVMDIENGSYTLTYEDAEGNSHEQLWLRPAGRIQLTQNPSPPEQNRQGGIFG